MCAIRCVLQADAALLCAAKKWHCRVYINWRPIHHCRPAAKCELSLQFQDNDTSVTLILPRDISQPTSHPSRTAVYFRRVSIANLYTVFMVARSGYNKSEDH